MTKTWLFSDIHFSHSNTWMKFTKEDGSPLRPFNSNEEMNETIVNNWNSVVQPEDRAYILGDVVINRKAFPYIKRLQGRKALIMGNHDLFKIQEYIDVGFDKILGSHKLDKYILTHIPIHEASLPHWARANIHGHLHSNVLNDPRYINMSVEQLNYTPIDFEDVKERIESNYKMFEKYPRVWNWAYDKSKQHVWTPAGMSHKDGVD